MRIPTWHFDFSPSALAGGRGIYRAKGPGLFLRKNRGFFCPQGKERNMELSGIKFVEADFNHGYGYFFKCGRRFYRGNIFDTPVGHDGNYHEYIQLGMARIFDYPETPQERTSRREREWAESHPYPGKM